MSPARPCMCGGVLIPGSGRVYPSAGTGVCVGADREKSQSQSQRQSQRRAGGRASGRGRGKGSDWLGVGYKRSGLMGQSGSDGQESHSWLHLSVSSDCAGLLYAVTCPVVSWTVSCERGAVTCPVACLGLCLDPGSGVLVRLNGCVVCVGLRHISQLLCWQYL